jgi:hypothetical protein
MNLFRDTLLLRQRDPQRLDCRSLAEIKLLARSGKKFYLRFFFFWRGTVSLVQVNGSTSANEVAYMLARSTTGIVFMVVSMNL